MTEPLLAIRDLASLQGRRGRGRGGARASLDVQPNRTVAVVGESGSGKTVISQAILGILPANRQDHRRVDLLQRSAQQPAQPLDLAALAQDSDPSGARSAAAGSRSSSRSR